MKRISAQTYQSQPWRNGGGVTREIAAELSGERLLWLMGRQPRRAIRSVLSPQSGLTPRLPQWRGLL